MAEPLGYDPYEWFDPETGRAERQRLNSLVHLAIGRQQVRPTTTRAFLMERAGVESLRDVPLDAIGKIIPVFEAMKRDTKS